MVEKIPAPMMAAIPNPVKSLTPRRFAKLLFSALAKISATDFLRNNWFIDYCLKFRVQGFMSFKPPLELFFENKSLFYIPIYSDINGFWIVNHFFGLNFSQIITRIPKTVS